MEAYVKKCTPHLQSSSIKTYCCTLRGIFKHLGYWDSVENFSVDDFFESINLYLSSLPLKRRIGVISALFTIKQRHPELVKILKHCNEEDFNTEKKQELTPAQQMAYLDWDSIVRTRENLANAVASFWTKLTLSDKQFDLLQDYVICCLYTYLPPRRLLDYVHMRKGEPENDWENGIVQISNETTNSQSAFVFQKYKTAKTYGKQEIPIPLPLWCILREWIKINPYDWLLVANGKQMTSVSLTRRLSQIFETPGFGVNMLRHAFVSDNVLKDTPFLDQLENIAYALGHSMNETMLYKKHI
jgi:hypothetical protein